MDYYILLASGSIFWLLSILARYEGLNVIVKALVFILALAAMGLHVDYYWSITLPVGIAVFIAGILIGFLIEKLFKRYSNFLKPLVGLIAIVFILDTNDFVAKKTYALLGYDWKMDFNLTGVATGRVGDKEKIVLYAKSGRHEFLVEPNVFPRNFSIVQLLTPDNKIKFCMQKNQDICLN